MDKDLYMYQFLRPYTSITSMINLWLWIRTNIRSITLKYVLFIHVTIKISIKLITRKNITITG